VRERPQAKPPPEFEPIHLLVPGFIESAESAMEIRIMNTAMQRSVHRTAVQEHAQAAWETALIAGDVDEVLAHIKAGCDVEGCVFGWCTPLAAAAAVGHVGVAHALLQAGVTVDRCATRLRSQIMPSALFASKHAPAHMAAVAHSEDDCGANRRATALSY
jgi:hypothetical protein